jgi:uncharacterized linocin/CFP29 family protein
MDILKQNLAPITDEAWDVIKNEAVENFNTLLTARRVVQVTEPKGWNYAAVPTGKLNIPQENNVIHDNIEFGLREALPLLELRIPFELDVWDLDNIVRGSKQYNLDSMQKAAGNLARFEDGVIFNGLNNAAIKGLKESSDHEHVGYPKKVETLPQTIAHCINILNRASVNGPFSLIVGAEKWEKLTTHIQGYPLIRRLEEIIEGSIIVTQNSDDAFLVPENDNKLVLTLGNDIAIGYESHDRDKVKLYFTESFMFQVLDASEIIVLV